MAIVNIRELSRRTTAVLTAVVTTRRPAIIMRNGAPVAAVVPIDTETFEDYVLATAPEYVSGMAAVDREIAAGTFTGRPLAEVEAEIAGMADDLTLSGSAPHCAASRLRRIGLGEVTLGGFRERDGDGISVFATRAPPSVSAERDTSSRRVRARHWLSTTSAGTPSSSASDNVAQLRETSVIVGLTGTSATSQTDSPPVMMARSPGGVSSITVTDRATLSTPRRRRRSRPGSPTT